jgi:uncharacterized repeat protein (TIGR01451 family)
MLNYISTLKPEEKQWPHRLYDSFSAFPQKSNLFRTIVCIVISFCCPEIQAQEIEPCGANAVVNGAFDGDFTNWVNSGWTRHSSGYAIGQTTNGTDHITQNLTDIYVKPDGTFEVKFRFLTQSLNSPVQGQTSPTYSQARFRVKFNGVTYLEILNRPGVNNNIDSSPLNGATVTYSTPLSNNAWTTVTLSIPYTASNIGAGALRFEHNTWGTYDKNAFDDVYVEKACNVSENEEGLYSCVPNLSCGGTQDYSNYGFNSTDDQHTIEYDNFNSAFHSTIVRTALGVKAWGEMMTSAGGNALVPIDVTPANYPGLTGDILKIGIGGQNGNNKGQAVILTSTGLFAWGAEAKVLRSAIKSGNSFSKIMGTTIDNADPATALPVGLAPEQVKIMFVSNYLLALTTCDGRVYILSNGSPNQDPTSVAGNGQNGENAAAVTGNGLSTFSTSSPRERWYQVMKSPGVPLTNVVAARGNGAGTMMALDGDGKLWTWGFATYLGNSSAQAPRTYATEMTLPNYTGSGHIKMIGMTSQYEIGSTQAGATGSSYFVLYSDGTLYSMGDNRKRQLGDFTVTTRTTWVRPLNSLGGTPIENIKWISPNEHVGKGITLDANNNVTSHVGAEPAVNVILGNGNIVNWGSSDGHMLGRGDVPAGVNPGSPTSLSGGKYLVVETGGHTTMTIRQCNTNFGYVGHRVSGSMANGSSANVFEPNFTFNTAPLKLCGASPNVTFTPLNVCNFDTPFTVDASPEGGTFEVLSGNAIYTPTNSFTRSGPGSIELKYTTPAGCDILSANLTIPVDTCSDPEIKLVKTGVLSSDGNTITYTFTVTNTGDVPLNPVTVTDSKVTPSSITLAATSLAVGQSTTGTATYTVTQEDRELGEVQNTAEAVGIDPYGKQVADISGTNQDNDNPTIVTIPTADLQIEKSGPATVTAGGAVTYTLVVTNNGPSAANNARVSDPNVPNFTALTVVCGAVSGGAVCPTTGNLTLANLQSGAVLIPTLPSGGSVTFTVTGTAGASGTIQNIAEVISPVGIVDLVPGNNKDTVNTVINAPSANLKIVKSGPSTILPNGLITYTLVVTNSGPSAADNSAIQDAAVANFAAASVTCGAASGGAVCPTSPSLSALQAGTLTIPTLPSGGSITLTVTGEAGASGGITNTATVTPPPGTTDPDPSNNTSTVVTTINCPTVVAPTVGAVTQPTCEESTGSVTLNGLPATGTWTLTRNPGAVTSTGTGTTTTVSALASGSYTFTVTDANGCVSTASANVDITAAICEVDLSIVKSGPATALPNGQVVYTLLISNNGPVAADGATITDPAVANFTVSAIACTSSTGGATCPTIGSQTSFGTLTVGTFPANSSVTIQVTGEAGASGGITNTATVTPPSGITDSNTSNNTSTVVTTINCPTVVAPTVGAVTQPTCEESTGSVTLSGLPATGTWTLTRNPGAVTSTGTGTTTTVSALASGSYIFTVTDANGCVSTASANVDITAAICEADLVVTKAANTLTPAVGDQVTFTITATNNGPNAATGVVVNELMPAGYTFVSASSASGVWASPNWTIGDMANGATATLTVVAIVNATGPYTNTVTIDGNEPDPVSENNTDTETVVPKRCPDGVNCLSVRATKVK